MKLIASIFKKQKFIIFFSALVARLVLNIAFLGSCDLLLAISLFKDVCTNGFPYPQFVPYFPVMPLLLWLQGFAAVVTNVPINFWMKFFPSVFDACTAVLIFKILNKQGIKKSFGIGLLYAFSPISLIVTSIHGQWDSLPLFFLAYSFYLRDFHEDNLRKYFFFGLSFALSFLLKPYTLLFIFFIFEPYKNIRQELGKILNLIIMVTVLMAAELVGVFLLIKRSQATLFEVICDPYFIYMNLVLVGMVLFYAIFLFYQKSFSKDFQRYFLQQSITLLGLLSCIGLFGVIFKVLGFDIVATSDTVLRHFNSGASNFGVPFLLDQQRLLFLMVKNRIWQLGFIFFVTYYYYTKKIGVFESIAVVFTFIFIFSAYSGPYLLWSLPFLFLINSSLALAFYNLIVGSFVLLTYTYPFSHPAIPFLMGLALAPLKCCPWLQLPTLFLSPVFSWIIPLVGNVIVPVLCAYVCMVLLKKTIFNSSSITTSGMKPILSSLSYPWALIFMTALIVMFFVFYFSAHKEFLTVSNDFYDFYAFSIVEGRPCALYGGSLLINSGYLFLTLIVGWSVAAYRFYSTSRKV